MKIIGLTGSIGMGKTTTAGMFKTLGVPVFDADAENWRLVEERTDVRRKIGAIFPDILKNGKIDRRELRKRLLADFSKVKEIEAIMHPLIYEEARAFLLHHEMIGTRLVVLDVPLLYEAGFDRLCNAVIVVSAPAHVQEKRVLARKGVTPAWFKAVKSNHLDHQQKCARADFVVQTDIGKRYTLQQIKRIINQLQES